MTTKVNQTPGQHSGATALALRTRADKQVHTTSSFHYRSQYLTIQARKSASSKVSSNSFLHDLFSTFEIPLLFRRLPPIPVPTYSLLQCSLITHLEQISSSQKSTLHLSSFRRTRAEHKISSVLLSRLMWEECIFQNFPIFQLHWFGI